MKSVLFMFRERTAEENQDRIGRQVLRLPGVRAASRISPDATRAGLRRLWYAEVSDAASAANVVRRLRAYEDIQSVEFPAERGLG
jgi:hypothetical protein